ncbi:ATP-binding protein, partial [Nocardioides sp.]|uniref:sensor histidine kinase n=1 Tax=Nocardioides sp. TaxID=35761 RepID=UPI00286C9246
GGFGAWDEHGVYFATGRAATSATVLRLAAADLKRCADAWFPFGVHFINGLVSTVRRIEAGARQREALVALGTLAAGLPHELNNPASAATRAVDTLGETSEALLGSLRHLAERSITAEQYVALDHLRREPTPTVGADALVAADAEDTLSDWLVDHGVDREWILAPTLAAAGADVGWCERVEQVLGRESLGPGLEWLASSFLLGSLLTEVKDSTRRISDLVATVRSYSQLDRASVQDTDVTEGLDSTLVMLGHKLEGVRVVRRYAAGVPRIEAIPGELNQVWTNLVDNAVDAMGGVGTLTVSAYVDELGKVVVEVADSGPGMPAEVRARAFEPFFTTKDVGRGTGLGLDISRRIVVERHAGEIEIDSTAGGTVLRVRLPLRSARGGADAQ